MFFDWMVAHYADDMNNIRLKTLEYIIWGEKKHLKQARSIMDLAIDAIILMRPWHVQGMKNCENGFWTRW